jgi:hypothetical protein
MPTSHPKTQVLPILAELCDLLDQAFIEQVGPFGELIVGETRAAWMRGGPRIRATDVEAYIALLAREITDTATREHFLTAAREVVGNY